MNISTIGTPTVLKLAPAIQNYMTNKFAYMFLQKNEFGSRKLQKSVIFRRFREKLRSSRICKIAQKYPILKLPTSLKP